MDYLIKLGNKVNVFNAVAIKTKIDKKYNFIMDELVVHNECFNKLDRYIYPLKQLKIYKALISSYKIEQFEIIHSHTLFNGGYAAYLVKKQFGIPYVVSVRNTDINVFLKIPLFKNVANKIVNNASGVQFLSIPYKEQYLNNFVSDEMKEKVNQKSVVINNGLEEYWLEHKARAKDININESIKILCVGKIDKNKNINTTINALNILISKGYKIELTIVGQVIDKEIFENIQKVNFVKIIPYLTKEELIKVYRENHLFVMPSITETFGRVYAEAMTQGLPVIYTRGQGFDGIFKDGCVGYSVPSDDEQYISECILNIINDYRNMSARCIDNCVKFDWNLIAERLENFYVNSLDRGREIL
jgi:glycosyltransferase involved in cell wall biosynthesis